MRCPATDSPACAGSMRMTIAATTARKVAQCGTDFAAGAVTAGAVAVVAFVMMGKSCGNGAGAAPQASNDTPATKLSLAPQRVVKMRTRPNI